MRQSTIDEIALGAARGVERIIAEEHPSGPVQRQAKVQVLIADWVRHAVLREVRNDRRRVSRRS